MILEEKAVAYYDDQNSENKSTTATTEYMIALLEQIEINTRKV